LEPVVAEGALLRGARHRVHLDDAERTGRNAVPAAIAGVRLNHHRIELRSNDGAGGAHLETAGLDAVLADVAHQEPASVPPVLAELLDESHMTPVDAVESARVVVAVAAQRVQPAVGAGQLIPLLACHFARLAADTNGRIGVKPHGLRHGKSPSGLGYVAHEGLPLVN